VKTKETLGRGKFGVVVKGFNERTNQTVAVKISPNNWKLDKEGLAKIQEVLLCMQ
jgi:serine/threonine protein kinase